MKFNFHNLKGFTLIETMVALTILIVAISYLIGFFPMGLNTAMSAKQDSLAALLAQGKIEELIGTPYAEVAVGTVIENSLNSIDPDFSGFRRTTSINYVDANLNNTASNSGLKKITVSVSWRNNIKQTDITTTLTTLITEL